MKGKSRVVRVVGLGAVEVAEVDLPQLDPRDILGKVEMAGICGTDVHMIYDAESSPGVKRTYPFGVGHETVCTIAEMGANAPRQDANGTPLAVGDRIVYMGARCGECYFCEMLDEAILCNGRGIGRRERSYPRIGGGYADYVYIPGNAVIVRIPDSVSTKAAALVEPLAGATRAMERAYIPGVPDRQQGMGPGKIVLVQGSGPVGVLLVALARIVGAYKVLVVGAPENRLAMCRELGADLALNYATTSAAERAAAIRAMTPFGIGPDIVIEAAGAPAAFIEAIDLVRNGGTIVEHGHFTYRGTIAIDPTPIVLKDLHILGNTGYYSSGFNTAVRILEANAGKVPFERIVTHEYPLSKAQEALEAARGQECVKAVLVPSLG